MITFLEMFSWVVNPSGIKQSFYRRGRAVRRGRSQGENGHLHPPGNWN